MDNKPASCRNTTDGIVIIGTGNVAFHIVRGLYNAGWNIVQVYGRNPDKAQKLAEITKSVPISSLNDIITDAGFYIISVSDSAIEEVASNMPKVKGMVVHTAGSVPMDLLSKYHPRHGVFYPLQSFSRDKEVDWSKVPLFLESCPEPEDRGLLSLAESLSGNTGFVSSEIRKSIHLAAVFAGNFVNYCYTAGHDILKNCNIDPSCLHPLMREVLDKAIAVKNPALVQTGPALRKDIKTINSHLDILKNNTILHEVYEVISRAIMERNNHNT